MNATFSRYAGLTASAAFRYSAQRWLGTARPDSDIDLLVEFEPGRVPGLLGLSEIELALGRVLGKKVDLRTAADLSPHFRDEVLRTAQVAYAG